MIALALANGLVLVVLAYLLVQSGEAPEVRGASALPGTFADAVQQPNGPGSSAEDRPGGAMAEAPGSGAGDLAALEPALRAVIDGALARAREELGPKAPVGPLSVALRVFDRAPDGAQRRAGIAFSADRSLRPASNMKLVTTAAALVALGPAWEFRTPVELGGSVVDGALRGDLILRAGGDPFYTREDDPPAGRAPGLQGDLAPHVAPLLMALRGAGIQRITGDIILDEAGFVRPVLPSGWPSSDQHVQEYCALSGGFTANAGCLTATLRPGAPGQRAHVSLRPASHGLRENVSVTTTARRSTLRIAVEARDGRVLVKGGLPADVPLWSARFSHPDPVALFGEALLGCLREGGFAVHGSWRRGSPPQRGPPLITLTTPLAACLLPINTDSNNAVAEQVFLALGREHGGAGSRAGGGRATAAVLDDLGVGSKGLVQVDGSGLSRDNRATARQIAALIGAVLDRGGEAARLFRSSLAVAGRTGTLAERMGGTPAEGHVLAKTGWIEGTSALSGVVLLAGGRERVFSILVAYPRVRGLNRSIWKPMQDEICVLLAKDHG